MSSLSAATRFTPGPPSAAGKTPNRRKPRTIDRSIRAPDIGLRRLTVRRRLRQTRWQLAAVAAVIVAAAATIHTLWQAEAARSAWTDTQLVVVAANDVEAGSTLNDADLRIAELPIAGIPKSAVEPPLPDLVGRVVTRPVFAGEVMVAGRLAPQGLSPTAQRIPSGYRAMTVPTTQTSPVVSTGDRIDLVSVPTAAPGSQHSPGTTIATGIEVLDVTAAAITVAVPGTVVGALAAATVRGTVVPAVMGN